MPWFDGAKLDDIIDYLTYVFVPALFVWRGALVPTAWALPVAGAMLLSSAYGFNRADAKTADHFFTGFPSVLEHRGLLSAVARWPSAVNAAILLALAVLVSCRSAMCIRRERRYWRVRRTCWRGLGGADAADAVAVPGRVAAAFFVSLAYPAYYFLLSFALHLQAQRHT